MGFVVEPGEPIEAGLVRVASATAGSALEWLAALDRDPVGAVHEARRNIRAIRALLRLLRPVLGEEVAGPERERLRQAAGLLSPHRDAHVQLATFEQLTGGVDPAEAARLEWIRRLLGAELERSCGPLPEHAAAAGALVSAFRDTLASRGPEFECGVVRKALRRSARRVRRSRRRAHEDPTPERLHELRKRCKDTREQLRALMPVEPKILGRLERRYDRVCALLGEARDLQMLGESLGAIGRQLPEAGPLLQRIRTLAAERERLLIGKGLRHARRATAYRPKKLAAVLAPASPDKSARARAGRRS